MSIISKISNGGKFLLASKSTRISCKNNRSTTQQQQQQQRGNPHRSGVDTILNYNLVTQPHISTYHRESNEPRKENFNGLHVH